MTSLQGSRSRSRAAGEREQALPDHELEARPGAHAGGDLGERGPQLALAKAHAAKCSECLGAACAAIDGDFTSGLALALTGGA